MTTCRLNGT